MKLKIIIIRIWKKLTKMKITYARILILIFAYLRDCFAQTAATGENRNDFRRENSLSRSGRCGETDGDFIARTRRAGGKLAV